jgi:DUF1680 family protein
MQQTFHPMQAGRVKLLPGLLQDRVELNRAYLMSLSNDNLLQNFYFEAGLADFRQKHEDMHWGWESPTCQLRGHFLGHWLSAAAHLYAATGDAEVKAKADTIVRELGRCQQANGGEWVGSIPEKYLDFVVAGQRVWAPQYTLHKTLMGLYDMYALADNQQALEIMITWARWFYRWTGQFSREQMDDILDVETGGMLEVWANLYGVTHDEQHLELLRRYDRPRLFEPLLAGEDVLTNMHANTTIPEVLGAARAWEVTGEQRWRDIVEAYWRMAVTERGYFCTGGQTCGEVWTPPHEQAARLGDKNQEHCTVYNMMLLADRLMQWTGDLSYADYWERNLYNGILAQQNHQTGMIAYFLPLEAGGVKRWGTPTHDFWCCHGTLVQAHTLHTSAIYYEDADGLIVAQYLPSELTWQWAGTTVHVKQTIDQQTGATRRPNAQVFEIAIACEQPADFTIKLRVPWWVASAPQITINGEQVEAQSDSHGVITIKRSWQNDRIRVTLPKQLTSHPLPDQPSTVAFLDGPVVLAGLVDEERTLIGDKDDPDSLLAPDNEREWTNWMTGYRTKNQERNFRLLPLYQILDQPYTVYFPVQLTK